MVMVLVVGLTFATLSNAQGSKRNKPLADHPQAVGEAGIAWFTTWESGVAEAKRSDRPIFFMAAATCEVPGAF